MQILRNTKDLKAYREGLSGKLAFIPTMGALHAGHLSLIKEGAKAADITLASIYVNPTQFAPHEDLDAYPRAVEDDIEKLKSVSCDALWLPTQEDMYPGGEVKVDIDPGEIGKPLEGEFRPHFFGGVATVVRRLFDHVKPDMAVFGEKDWQQLQVIKQMVERLNLDIEIIGGELIRDENGLALSSRNAYLSEAEYEIACHLNRTLFSMAEKIRDGADITDIEVWGAAQIIEAGFEKVDYCAVRDAHTLQPSEQDPLRILAAGWCGKARLLDNVSV